MFGVAVISCIFSVAIFFIALDADKKKSGDRAFWFEWSWRFAVLWLLALIASKL